MISKRYVIVALLVFLLIPILPVFRASATSTTIAVNPPSSYVTVGATFSVDINVTNVANLTSWQFTLYFLNSVLNCTNVAEGPFLKTGGGTYFGDDVLNNYNATCGRVLAYSTLLGNTTANGSGVLATITFSALSVGDTTLQLSETKLGDQEIPPQQIDHADIGGTVHVQSNSLIVYTVGSGAVTLNDSGPYNYGDVVLLTAVPSVGWSFASWSGSLVGSANPATLVIIGNMNVTATFAQNVYTLSVFVFPVGSGSVALNSTGPYHYGDVVQLNATPSVGWTFLSWSGNLAGSANPAALTITGNMAVTATFAQNVYTLSVFVFPVGSGSVALNSTGPYHYGDVVQLIAVPSVGWSFASWSGSLVGSANPGTLQVIGNMNVTATFTQNVYTLSVFVFPVGSGSVALNSTGPYHYGDVVQLNATPSVGWTFLSWSGNLAGSANPAALTITGNMAVTATFAHLYTLSYFVFPVGSGSVTLNPSQLAYPYGTIVTLTASPAVGWVFAGWSGDVSGTSNPITVNMTSNKVVNATFLWNVFTLEVSVVPSNGGSVSLNNTGPYHYGDCVALWAVPSAGWFFQGWSGGGLSGSVQFAALIMTGNFSVTAYFNVSNITLQMSPASKTCRIYGENFTVGITIVNATLVTGFTFEIHYNTTLLAYSGVIWNAWGSGTINVNGVAGYITGFTSGTSINGTQTLISLEFQTCFYHVWKNASNWTNDMTGAIFFQSASVNLSSGPKLTYQRGGTQNQISVGPDFAYTFSPIQGDVNNDGTVDIFDLRSVGAYFNAKQGDPNWTQASTYDLNGDGTVDILDLRTVAGNFGYTYIP